ncbi:MAG: DUF1385 domain-containing protein [Eubacteriales bacterium]|nr:DUF1385 domain-containing protein [Eubacteriales bacterium]
MNSIENNRKNRAPDIGGQAVLDGVMMKSPDAIAIAVRRENGDIVVKRQPYTSPSKKHAWMGKPIIRGAVNMGLMMKLGVGVLHDSADMSGALADEKPSKFEAWLSKKLGKGADKVLMGLALVLALALSLGLFVLLPNIPTKAMRAAGWSHFSVNLASGLIRTVILIGYLYLTGLVPDMRRTFQYHGSEHKTVYAHEAGLPLTPENAQKFSTLHPRCGTSFLLLTFILSILFYSVFDELVLGLTGYDMAANYFVRILSRILLLPLMAGLGYEALKALAHANNPLTRALRWPGMQLQRLTTKPPTDEMLEVAIAAMNAALEGLPEGARTKEGYTLLPKAQPKEAVAV